MSEIKLSDLIREVCDASDSADPDVLAKEVAHRVPKGQALAALQQVLPLLVQHELSRGRRGFAIAPAPRSDDQPADLARPGRSWKVDGIREAWAAVLRNRVAVGDGAWKFLADCTVPDLEHAAAVREDMARANARSAEQYRRLAALLAEHGAAVVRDLPDDAIGRVFGGAP